MNKKYKFTEIGYCYTSYIEFVKEFYPQYENNFKNTTYPSKTDVYILRGEKEHPQQRNRVIGVFQNMRTSQIHLIGMEGEHTFKTFNLPNINKHYKGIEG